MIVNTKRHRALFIGAVADRLIAPFLGLERVEQPVIAARLPTEGRKPHGPFVHPDPDGVAIDLGQFQEIPPRLRLDFGDLHGCNPYFIRTRLTSGKIRVFVETQQENIPMTTLKQVKALAATLGASVEDERCGNFHECRVEAPHRKRWKCDGIHELVDSTNRPWKPDYADMLDRMNFGVEDCTDPECEWCES